jgi:hypothetical protein
LPETRIRDFLYGRIGEAFLRRELVGQLPRWPRPEGAYRLFSTALAGSDGDYLVHLILTDPLASEAQDAKVIIVAAEVIRVPWPSGGLGKRCGGPAPKV